MRPASEAERRRLNETFAALCAIPSPSGDERDCADAVTAQLRGMGLEVAEDDAAAQTGSGAGNLLTRLPTRGRTPERTLLLCAHLDTVPVEAAIEGHGGQAERRRGEGAADQLEGGQLRSGAGKAHTS